MKRCVASRVATATVRAAPHTPLSVGRHQTGAGDDVELAVESVLAQHLGIGGEIAREELELVDDRAARMRELDDVADGRVEVATAHRDLRRDAVRSEEHTPELQ